MGTIIKDNMNPIERVKPQALIDNQVQSTRLLQYFPDLFAPSQADEEWIKRV